MLLSWYDVAVVMGSERNYWKFGVGKWWEEPMAGFCR